MKKYEYKTTSTVVADPILGPLDGDFLTNVYGEFGWRLVSMTAINGKLHYTFMREKE